MSAVWPVLLTWWRKKKWESPSVSASYLCLSVSTPLLPLSSAAVHPAPLAVCMTPSQQINHSSPGGQPLCSSAYCCRLPCLCGNDVLWAASTWPCFDTAENSWLFWLRSEPHHSTLRFLHGLFSRQWPQRFKHATEQDAGPLCHQLMISPSLPECLEQTPIRAVVLRGREWAGGIRYSQKNTEHSRVQANQIVYDTTVKLFIGHRGDNSSLLTARWYKISTELWFGEWSAFVCLISTFRTVLL